MGKHESPILRMTVQGDRLVPTAAWEAERLSTYRTGSVVIVIITQQKNRKLERKYWAILNRVVKDCPVPWRTAEDAHRAIRLALGVVEPFVTAGGKMHAEVKSTADMDDPEYQRYYEDAMALLSRLTGVDPETLHLEAADVGGDEPSSDLTPSSDDAGNTDTLNAADPVAEFPGDEPGPETGAIEAQAEPVAAPVSADLRIANLMREAVDKFIAVATDPKVPDAKLRQDNVVFAKNVWKDELRDNLDFVKACTDTANRVVKGDLPADQAREYLEALIARGETKEIVT